MQVSQNFRDKPRNLDYEGPDGGVQQISSQ